jgi:hypothetical protein
MATIDHGGYKRKGYKYPGNLFLLADKIQPTQINVISTEMPDPTQDPDLFAVVTKNMIHGSCGHLSLNSPCMKDGKCTKNYARKLIKETQTGNDDYSVYRRRAPEDEGFTATLKITQQH